ncbi:hypothetical protein [Gallaecimonas sp. GXIMD4217]|uniref:hypothetical protein n=1 Tax=Gallaecimonas sp. GXIMD4217 TaxID=3131927 RepID=UPI00311AED63
MATTIFGLICLLPLGASLLMAVVAQGGERFFYASCAGLLALLAGICLGMTEYLELGPNGRVTRIRRLLGRRSSKVLARKEAARLLLSPFPQARNHYQLSLLGQHYPLGGLAKALAITRFVAHKGGLEVDEQISAWPETRPLSPDVKPPAGADVVETRLWSPGAVLRMLLPLLVFLGLGTVLSLLGARP